MCATCWIREWIISQYLALFIISLTRIWKYRDSTKPTDELKLKKVSTHELQCKPTMRKQWHTFTALCRYRCIAICTCCTCSTTIIPTIIEIQSPYSKSIYKRFLLFHLFFFFSRASNETNTFASRNKECEQKLQLKIIIALII